MPSEGRNIPVADPPRPLPFPFPFPFSWTLTTEKEIHGGAEIRS